MNYYSVNGQKEIDKCKSIPKKNSLHSSNKMEVKYVTVKWRDLVTLRFSHMSTVVENKREDCTGTMVHSKGYLVPTTTLTM